MKQERKNKIKQYTLIGIGFFILALFIYFRFIRERLPKIIPFELNEWTCYILLYICIIYGVIFFLTLFPPKEFDPTQRLDPFTLYVMSVTEKLYAPLFALQSFVFSFKGVRKVYLLFLSKIDKYTSWIQKCDNMVYFHYIVYIIPRFIFVIVFFFDIFYFRMLVHIYTLSFLFFIFLLYQYITYLFQTTLVEYLQELDADWLVEITSKQPEDDDEYFYLHLNGILWFDETKWNDDRFDVDELMDKKEEGTLTIQELNHLDSLLGTTPENYEHILEIWKFLFVQVPNRTEKGYHEFTYKCRARRHVIMEYVNSYGYWEGIRECLKEKGLDAEDDFLKYREKHERFVPDLNDPDWQEITAEVSKSPEFDYLMPIMISLNAIVDNYDWVKKKDPNIKRSMIGLTALTWSGWLYILYVSFDRVYLNTLFSIFDKIEPFSDLMV